jgi:hypothetical protein
MTLTHRGGLDIEELGSDEIAKRVSYGRMIGAAAEIDDHLNLGRNMDTRTAVDRCEFVI